jgi:integrase
MARRTRIAPGIYQDAHGFSVIARVGSGARQLSTPEIRYPPDTPLPTMVARWHREKMRLTDEIAKAGDGPVSRGTLAADVRTYLETATLTPQRKTERADQLQWWCESFGTRRRAELQAPDLRRALNGLSHKGRDGKTPMAASTVNKYRFALSHVYTVLDGKEAANPLRNVPKYTEPEAAARDVSYEIIDRIIDEIRERGQTLESVSLTRARVRVFAYAPVTPAQLRHMKRSDVDWARREMITPGRKKGQGTRPRGKPLTALGLAAFQAFDAADGWEKPFSRSSLHRTFTAARDRAVAALRLERPDLDLARAETMRPYDLRHSFATKASRVIGNEAVVAELLDHADLRTTRRYTQGALQDHLRGAGAALDAAFAAPHPKPAAVKAGDGAAVAEAIDRRGTRMTRTELHRNSTENSTTAPRRLPPTTSTHRLQVSGNIRKKAESSTHRSGWKNGL